MKEYRFETTCVESTARLIHDMVDQAVPVTYETMLRHCDEMLEIAQALGYEKSRSHGLTLKDDWHVGYFKSFYDGYPCYYFVWSAIEHIWVRA